MPDEGTSVQESTALQEETNSFLKHDEHLKSYAALLHQQKNPQVVGVFTLEDESLAL